MTELILSFPAAGGITLSARGIQGPGGSGGGISDGDKGHITVSSSGAVWRINEGAVNDENIVSVDWSKITSAPESFPSYWEGISGIPSEFPPSSHTHTASGITNFDSASRSVVLSGYSASGSRLALAATDTILGAFGKIGKWLSDLATVAFSGSASDLTTGTLPIDRIADGSITLAKVQDLSNTVSNMALVDVASGTIKGRATAGTGDPEDLTGTQATALLDAFTTTLKGLVPAPGSTSGKMLKDDGTWATPLESITIALSDLTTAITVGTGKETIRMPYAFTVTAVRAYLATAQTSGNIFTVDINEGGVSILSTKLTIDNAEKTSVTAATAAVISDANLADDAEITFDVDQVGDGTAKGLKVVLIGYRS